MSISTSTPLSVYELQSNKPTPKVRKRCEGAYRLPGSRWQGTTGPSFTIVVLQPKEAA